MKAIVCTGYGSPDALKLEEVDKPVPGDHEVLVRVRAAAVNFADRALMKGPFIIRIMGGGCANQNARYRELTSLVRSKPSVQT